MAGSTAPLADCRRRLGEAPRIGSWRGVCRKRGILLRGPTYMYYLVAGLKDRVFYQRLLRDTRQAAESPSVELSEEVICSLAANHAVVARPLHFCAAVGALLCTRAFGRTSERIGRVVMTPGRLLDVQLRASGIKRRLGLKGYLVSS